MDQLAAEFDRFADVAGAGEPGDDDPIRSIGLVLVDHVGVEVLAEDARNLLDCLLGLVLEHIFLLFLDEFGAHTLHAVLVQRRPRLVNLEQFNRLDAAIRDELDSNLIVVKLDLGENVIEVRGEDRVVGDIAVTRWSRGCRCLWARWSERRGSSPRATWA